MRSVRTESRAIGDARSNMATADGMPVMVTQEIMNDAKVKELGRWAFSIVTPVQALGRSDPPLGVAFPAYPLRRKSMVLVGDDAAFPNTWDMTRWKNTTLDTVTRDFVVVYEKVLALGLDIPLAMGRARVVEVSAAGEVLTVVKVNGGQDAASETLGRKLKIPGGVRSVTKQLDRTALAQALVQARERLTGDGGSGAAGGVGGGGRSGGEGGGEARGGHWCGIAVDLSGEELAPLWAVVEPAVKAAIGEDAASSAAAPLWLVARSCAEVWSDAEAARLEVDTVDNPVLSMERVEDMVSEWAALVAMAWPAEGTAEAASGEAAGEGGLTDGSSPVRRDRCEPAENKPPACRRKGAARKQQPGPLLTAARSSPNDSSGQCIVVPGAFFSRTCASAGW